MVGSADQLQQVVMNLALNAIDAAGPKGTVRVRARSEGTDAVLELDDDGPGVPAELRGRIFEPFFTTKPHGSGLGLPLVHGIVTQHGGSIGVDDVAPHGARFTLRIPRAT